MDDVLTSMTINPSEPVDLPEPTQDQQHYILYDATAPSYSFSSGGLGWIPHAAGTMPPIFQQQASGSFPPDGHRQDFEDTVELGAKQLQNDDNWALLPQGELHPNQPRTAYTEPMWSERQPGVQYCDETYFGSFPGHRFTSSISAKTNAYGGIDSFSNLVPYQERGFPLQQQGGIQHSPAIGTASRQLDRLAPSFAHQTYNNHPGPPCSPCQTFTSTSYSGPPYFPSVDTAVENRPRDAASLENRYSEEGYLPQTYADQSSLTCLAPQPPYLETMAYHPGESPHVAPPEFSPFEMDAMMYLSRSNASSHLVDAPFPEAGPSSRGLEDMPIFDEPCERMAGFGLHNTTPVFTPSDTQVVHDDFNYPHAIESPSASSSLGGQPDRSPPDADGVNDPFIIVSMTPPPQTHALYTPSPSPSSAPPGHTSHCQWLASLAFSAL
ncbi:hypothetical protein HWV62_24632 [Athelia sp. TMB]|nr:hypothetical protein HWV62_24632 [Athelia sp. TMB]